MSEDSGDAGLYETAKANIRDTVKWLAAALASLAAVVVGGISFTGIGALPILSGRFALAVISLLAGFSLVALALYKTLRLLRSDGLFASELMSTPAKEDVELQRVQAEIKKHKGELLPFNYPTIALLLEASRTEQRAMQEAIENNDTGAFQEHQRRMAALDVPIGRVLDFAVYSRMYHRLETVAPTLFLLTMGALVALLVFSAVVAQPEAAATPLPMQTTIIHEGCGEQCKSPAPVAWTAPVVRFATGSSTIDRDGIAAIAAVRNHLYTNPDLVVLLRAHTDTVATLPVNERLAHLRGTAVRKLLLEPGGIAANRVFIAELPELALPSVTAQETKDDHNRAVEFAIAQIRR